MSVLVEFIVLVEDVVAPVKEFEIDAFSEELVTLVVLDVRIDGGVSAKWVVENMVTVPVPKLVTYRF